MKKTFCRPFSPSWALPPISLVLLSLSSARAVDFSWNINGSGLFDAAGNWTPVGGPPDNVPLPADNAIFDQSATYTVTFQTNKTNGLFRARDGNVTSALSGQTYTLTGTASSVGDIDGQIGRLTLSNGTVAGTGLDIGVSAADTGILTVSSNAALTLSSTLSVGNFGTGTLVVQNGGDVTTSGNALIGCQVSSLGTTTVTGAGSTWTANGQVTIGSASTGTLSVASGGVVNFTSATTTTVGTSATAEGTISVSGPGSTFSNFSTFLVGNNGRGTMNVTNGGLADINGSFTLGNSATGVGTLTVSGAGSTFMGTALTVGGVGDGEMTVTAGGMISTSSATIASNNQSTGNATVAGSGSIWTSTGPVIIGADGAGTLSVLDGAMVNSSSTTLGSMDEGDGTLNIDGPGSSYRAEGNIVIGSSGRGIATVGNGAAVSTTGRVEVASAASSFVSSLVVSGDGSNVTAPGGVFVAGSSAAMGGSGQLTVSDGGFLDAAGGTVKIWNVFMSILQIHGGTIHARNFERLGSFNFRDGLLHVDGGIFTNGAADAPLVINGATASDVPTLRLSNIANTNFISTLTVGDSRQGRLELLSGASSFPGGNVTIANGTNSSGSVLASGANTFFLTVGGMTVGASGTGTLEISDGAVMGIVSAANIGLNASGTGVATVSDARWENFDALNVGNAGAGTLIIREGGFVASNSAAVGLAASGNGAVSVTGPGSRWQSGAIVVASAGRGTLSLDEGGSMFSDGATLASAAGSFATVTLDGPGTDWIVNGPLAIGVAGNADLTVTGGARLASTHATLAEIASGFFGTAAITGPGSVWTNNTGLFIGGTSAAAGGVGILAVENGGTLNTGTSAGDNLKVWPSGGLTLNGGTINARRFENLGTFNFNDGLLNVSGLFTFTPFGIPAPLVLNGLDADDRPTLRLSADATTSGITSLTVGATRQGALEIVGGSNLTATDGFIGSSAGSTGSVSLTGASNLTLTGSLSVGGTAATTGGAGTLSIGNGSLVDLPSGTLRLWPDGIVDLDGGGISMQTFAPNGGRFHFNSGTVHFTGGVALDELRLSTLLGPEHVLAAGRSLQASGVTTLASNLTVAGGALIVNSLTNDSTLAVQTGAVQVINTLTNGAGRLLLVEGMGSLTATGGINNAGMLKCQNNLVPISGGTLTNTGTILGSGLINNTLDNNSTGQVQATAGSRLEFGGGATSNAGVISIHGGEIQFSAALTNQAGTGLISGRDGILRVGGAGITNHGSLAFSNGTMDVYADITNSATGRIVVSGGGIANFYDDVANGGQIQVSKAGTLTSTAVFFGTLSGNGVAGAGNVFAEGDVRPGFSPGVMSFGGDLSFGPFSALNVEIGGATPGTQFDQVNVVNHASLGGTLDVSLINGFAPMLPGESFAIMNYGSHTGTFDAIAGQPSASLPGLFWTVAYTPNQAILTTSAVPGDINLDGTVNSVDVALFTPQLGTEADSIWTTGDFNDDSVTTLDDLHLLQFHLGQWIVPSSTGNTPVPEPSAWVVALLGAATILFVMGRRRS